MFDLCKGTRPLVIVILAVLAGAGVSLVGLFQGSNENVRNGLIAFHTSGAQGVMLAGNIMAIVVGANGARIGLGRGRSIASIVLGVVGLTAFPVFMADVFTGWMWNIGMFERGVIYPIMIGHVRRPHSRPTERSGGTAGPGRGRVEITARRGVGGRGEGRGAGEG
ncbi:hypothetical protein ACWCW2_40455, partial [Streptomyces sp. NPDC001773]